VICPKNENRAAFSNPTEPSAAALIWLSTFKMQVPAHERTSRGYSSKIHLFWPFDEPPLPRLAHHRQIYFG
jgi:hypothetical protein